jgi:(2Fe-2S) ferredoxin
VSPKKYRIMVCRGPECGDKRHSADVKEALAQAIKTTPLAGNEVLLESYSCFGKCQRGVNVLVREIRQGEARMLLLMPAAGPGATLYHGVKPSEVKRILEEHVAQGRVLVEWTKR